MTKIVVNNVWSRISDLDIKIMDILDKITSYYVEGYQYTKAFRNGWFDSQSGQFKHWDGKRHLISKNGVFPTGLLESVLECLNNNNIKYELVDNRKEEKGESLKIYNYKPRPYQEEALCEAVRKGNGIIRVGTGAGKTLIAAMITAHYNLPTAIYVVGKDLLYQFHREFSKMLGPEQVGIIGDGNCDIRRFNICSIWTAITAFDLKSKVSLDDEDWAPEVIEVDQEQKNLIRKVVENSKVAIYDEAHFIACETIQSIFKAAKKCRYVFGMTGTNWRDDGADIMLEAVCGQRIYNMPASKLIEQGYLVPPRITMLEVPPWPEKLPSNYSSVYKTYIVENDIRNNMIIDSTRKLIDMGRRPLILVRNLNHGRRLAKELSDISLYFVCGEVDGNTRESVKQDFQDGKLQCLIASSVFDIGVDISCLDALIMAGGGKSTVRTLQRVGRVIRLHEGKKFANIVDFIDQAIYLDKHTGYRLAIYETEPSFKIKFPKGFSHESIKRPKKVQEKINS